MPIVLERECLSTDEARDVFAELDDDALGDIHAAAGRLVAASPFFDEPRDLSDEALAAILDGRRRIPRSEPFTAAFIMVMKSIASHEAQKARRSTTLEEIEHEPCPRPSPERAAIATEKVRKVREAFAQDEAVSAILLAYEDGKSLPEIGELLEIAFQELEAGRKRLARWVERHGWKRDR